MFLDDTYFQGELYIPRSDFDDETGIAGMLQAVGEKNLSWYIEKYEREYLIRLLGRDMYKTFISNLNDGSDWLRLRDEIFVTSDGLGYSPAANYVYFYSMRDMQTQTSPKGEVRGKQDNATTVSAYDKLVRVWNDMVDSSREIISFILENKHVFGEPNGTGFDYINKFCI